MSTTENTAIEFGNPEEEVYVFPTTYPQQQLWFLNQLSPDSPAYNIPFAYDITGNIDASALGSAINEIIRRHETFRTTFADTENGPVQLISKQLQIDFPIVDFSGKTGEEIQEYIHQNSIRPFELGIGPLVRAELIKRNKTQFTLFLNFHHIILDHISIVQFADELEKIYESYVKNQKSPLVEPELQYADYAEWQQEWQTHQKLAPKLSYWDQLLKGRSEFLDIPTDYKRPSVQAMQGREYNLWFPSSLLDKLKQLSRSESVSMFIALLAGFSVILSRYTSQDEISVGTPFANRGNQPELEKVMGCFINTVPIFTDLQGDPSYREVLARVRKVVFGTNAHQEVPFEMIVETIKPKRDTSYNPLFQVAFTYQEPPMEINLSGCEVVSQCLHNDAAKFDILAWLWEAKDGIRGLLEYNTELFEYETIERFASHYQVLLESAVDNPDTPISKLRNISKKESELMVTDWNSTDNPYSNDIGIHGCFELQVDNNADKIAAVCAGEKLTYSELDNKANQLANYLLSVGVSFGELIAISVERSLDMLIGVLGVLKAGGCYIPLDPEYPDERLSYMLEDSGAKYLLLQESLKQQYSNYSGCKISLDSDWSDIEQQATKTPNITIQPFDLAYIIYTSGSTGKPKGVMVPHGAAVNFLCSMSIKPGLHEDDTLLAVTTLSFDIAVLELYLPLTVGGKVIIATSDEASDGNDLMGLLDDTAVNTMQATPATWRLLLASGWQGKDSLKVLCGGEALPADLVSEMLPKVGELWNMYGPTESTVWSTCYKITDPSAPILIGKPIHNTKIYVLDEHLSPVPLGVPGELYIGGDGVTNGYLNREELTAERFVNDPFIDGRKIYRTGDIVRYKADGNLEYHRRADNQVKVRGFRIELGEIETVLSKHENIKQSIIDVREDMPGDPRLVAYYISKENVNIVSTELRKFLRQELPDYMIPQYMVEVEVFPLTPNGKIDRKSLPSPFVATSDNEEIIRPRDFSEKTLANIWSRFLGIEEEKISIHDNFFEKGGHSLLSIQVIAKIYEISNVKLNPRVMILSSLEHIAPQCGFVEGDSSLDKKEDGFIEKLFKYIFNKK